MGEICKADSGKGEKTSRSDVLIGKYNGKTRGVFTSLKSENQERANRHIQEVQEKKRETLVSPGKTGRIIHLG